MQVVYTIVTTVHYTRFASAKEEVAPAHPLEQSVANVSHWSYTCTPHSSFHLPYSVWCQSRGLEDASSAQYSRQAHAPQATDGTQYCIKGWLA